MYNEWLPAVIGEDYMEQYELWSKYSDQRSEYNWDMNAQTRTEFGTAAFRFGHSMIGQNFDRKNVNTNSLIENVQLKDMFNMVTKYNEKDFLIEQLMNGMLRQPGKTAGVTFADDIVNNLFRNTTEKVGLDLPAFNIKRGRDHGIRPYVDYVFEVYGKKLTNWRQIGTEGFPSFIDDCKIMPSLYKSIEDMDLFIGGLCEEHVEGGMVGPTFATIIALQFHAYKFGDRFFVSHSNTKAAFTRAQFQAITEGATFHNLLCHSLEMQKIVDLGFGLGPQTTDCRDAKAIDVGVFWNY